ncbi:MAG: hypothetical protein ACYC2Y_07605 [Armatimonadota bacterium]
MIRLQPCDIPEDMIRHWPDNSQLVARSIMARYGPPDEALPSMLIWYANRPWLKTVVYREETPHEFPYPHTDILAQSICYRVPVGRFDDLAAFDGSVQADRTRGVLSAYCACEALNFIAINLAHEVVTEMRSVSDARSELAGQAEAYRSGRMTPYAVGFLFIQPQGDTRDLDRVK